MAILQTTSLKRRRSRALVGSRTTTALTFHGPFTFTKGDTYLFNTGFVKNEGIYIWTIKDEVDRLNYVHYIGETICFGRRQREHLIQITGLNYRIIDADFARQGLEKIVWNGMWRDRTPNAVADLLENYNEVSKKVVDYIGLITVYFAPTTLELHLRRHIEGCIAWNFYSKHPDLKKFYPGDHPIRPQTRWLGQRLILELPEDIAGIDREQII